MTSGREGNALRAVPEDWRDPHSSIRMVPKDTPWESLGRMLEEERPRGLGLVMPFCCQLHSYAYAEARARGIPVSLVPPANAMVLTGLMETAPIDSVVTTEDGARALAEDLARMGMLSRIRAWFIVEPPGAFSTYTPASGKIYRGCFL